MAYIKKQDAINEVLDLRDYISNKDERLAFSLVYKHLREMPTADVAEVVFCGECKHWGCVRSTRIGGKVGNCYNDGSPFHCEQPPIMKPTDFCSYGEKKAD